jgi:hypothetical protein
MAHINEFQPGDIITRIAPSKGNSDRSYWGDPLFYLGIANREVIVMRLTGYFKGKRCELPLDWWDEGWDYYTHPMSLLNNELLLNLLDTLKRYQDNA